MFSWLIVLASLRPALSRVLPGRLLPGQIRNFVSFGDSYTDLDGHWDGGIIWPVYTAEYNNLTLTGLAISGATCSESLTPRGIPDIIHNEIPTYMSTKDSLGYAPEETAFAIWIGTNDVGVLEGGTETAGVTYQNTTECAVGWVKTMYDSGARNFIFLNVSESKYSELNLTFCGF